MNSFRYPVVTDENIHPRVATYLREMGIDVLDIKERGLRGMEDVDILAMAHREGRVVLTHDKDFGTLAVAGGAPLTGILYIRPAEILPEVIINRLRHFFAAGISPNPPFIVVLQRNRVRIRNVPSGE